MLFSMVYLGPTVLLLVLIWMLMLLLLVAVLALLVLVVDMVVVVVVVRHKGLGAAVQGGLGVDNVRLSPSHLRLSRFEVAQALSVAAARKISGERNVWGRVKTNKIRKWMGKV